MEQALTIIFCAFCPPCFFFSLNNIRLTIELPEALVRGGLTLPQAPIVCSRDHGMKRFTQLGKTRQRRRILKAQPNRESRQLPIFFGFLLTCL